MDEVFSHIYLDTEVLEGNGWPLLSPELHTLLRLAQTLSIKVFIPEGAELEHQRRWLTKRVKDVDDLKQKNTELSRWGFRLGDSERAPITFELREKYRQLAIAQKEKWGIETIPLSSKAARELFKLAVNRTPPFQETSNNKVVGFQDAMIYFSALDHLQASGNQFGAFVSADAIFGKVNLRDLTRTDTEFNLPELKGIREVFERADRRFQNRVSVELRAFSGPELIEHLRGKLGNDVNLLWDIDRASAEHFLQGAAATAAIKKFLLAKLKDNVRQFVASDEDAFLAGLEIQQVRNIQTPQPSDRGQDQRVPLSFDIQVQLQLWVREYAKYMVGRSKDRDRRIAIVIRLEAEAVWNHHQYRWIVPTKLASDLDEISRQVSAARDLTGSVALTELVVRGEGFSELLGEIELTLGGVTYPAPDDFSSVDISVSIDTCFSCRIDANRVTNVALVSNKRGIVGWGALSREKWGDTTRENMIIFENVPLYKVDSRIDETLVIRGLRADCTAYNGSGPITAVVQVVTADQNRPHVALIREQLTFGQVRAAMDFSVEPVGRSAGLADSLRSEGLQRYHLLVSFEALFPGAFKTKQEEGSNEPSVADSGTVLMVTLANVPTGLQAFITTNDLQPSSAQSHATAVLTDSKGIRTQGELKSTDLRWDEASMVEITGLWRGTWEITSSTVLMDSPKLTFGVCFIGEPQRPVTFTVKGGLAPYYAPSSSIPGPRTSHQTLPSPRFLSLNAPIEVTLEPSQAP